MSQTPTPKTEFKKATSKSVLYTGLIILLIGQFIFWKNPKGLGPLGGIISFIGFMFIVFWFPNRKDEMCTFDANDNMTCVPIKK